MKTHRTLGTLSLCLLLIINVGKLPAEGNWTQKTDMPTVRFAFSTSIVDEKIFVIGGGIEGFGDIATGTVEMYDPKTDAWERKADMPTPRSEVATSVVDGKIYAIGGEEIKKQKVGPGSTYKTKKLPTVEMYDPLTDTWTQKADMPTPRSTYTCVVEGKIYAIGGSTRDSHRRIKSGRLKIVEVYDPATDTWAKAKSMNHARGLAAMSVVDGKIYVMGGEGWPPIQNLPGPFLSSVEIFNPKTNQWREKGEMPEPKTGHTASVINGKIYVLGGFSQGNGLGIRYFSTIDVYHPETDRWTQKPDMPVGKFLHRAEVIRGKIYIFGGMSREDENPLVTVEVYDTGEAYHSIEARGKLVKMWGSLKKSGN